MLTQVNFDWIQGEKLALMGANGSGKSTLARILAGLIQQESGEVVLDQNGAIHSWHDYPHWKMIGFVGQHPRRQTIGATVAEELGFGLLNQGMNAAEVKKMVKLLATQIGLQEQLLQSPATLSGGERQRLVIAAVLALQPAFIILDESISMLDLRARKRVFDLLDTHLGSDKESNRESGLGQLWITHDPEIALKADRLLVLQEGIIVEQGNPRDILADDERCREYGIRGLKESSFPQNISKDPILNASRPKARAEVLRWQKAEYKSRVWIDQVVKRNEFIGIIGPSGAGKTTLLESGLGLVTPFKGRFQAFDDESVPIPSKQLRNKIRLLQQEAGEYLLGRTVYDEIFYTVGKGERARSKEIHEQYLNQMSIPKIQWQQDPLQMSGGERQKVALAAALTTNPGILLFDEPLIGLDRQGRANFKAFMNASKNSYTILYVTHDLEEILDMATRLWLIENGRITFECEVGDHFLKERERFRSAGVKC
ncbi:ABC transporter ATP-binding protein [Desulfitobacterium metallireducens DSM 15288]|uniref:ABC transporter ATP-binding protein n=1 Tax=Desulfitobacterium metallireducens DSM 15288 TaxID=871968 RepID=W0EA38_9FIRM|nr:ABC transporter ATP-binding protein [Desulfitobacterium metallireducens DSM 15288]